MKILLVDDSRSARGNQKHILAQLGYTDVAEASDGVEAMSQISFERPDLMLVDGNLPNSDGIALIRKVRETDRSMPIIVCTTEAGRLCVLDALKAGVNNYIIKPFTAELLNDKIDQTLAKVGATRSPVLT